MPGTGSLPYIRPIDEAVQKLPLASMIFARIVLIGLAALQPPG
jgi:hypothetical protein